MSLNASIGQQTTSPGSSRASSPVPNSARRTEDASWKSDKSLRRFAASIARALSTWEAAPEEWADYIAFLGRLLKAVQSHGKDTTTLPHAEAVALRLSQCLSPVLPSGVHQKALEIYAYIFETFGKQHVAAHLSDYLPGLSTVLSFASLSVRPALYDLLERYVVALPHDVKRPAMKSLVLSLLPALEEETSEDFERAFDVVKALELGVAEARTVPPTTTRATGFFWQCMFLAILTGSSRRQGALNYCTRRLPVFSGASATTHGSRDGDALCAEAEAAITPEPGLLVRSFVMGLSDSQPLVQRGFLDLLVTNLPLNSPVLHGRVASSEFERLMVAATDIALRRDMSLNRRLWAWLLGPDSRDDGSASPTHVRRNSSSLQRSKQQVYFECNGLSSLQHSVLSSFSATNTMDLSRAFRTCHALMDRWEIGDVLIDAVFLPAMRSAFHHSSSIPCATATDVIKSARIFFDGVESRLIWSALFSLIEDTEDANANRSENLSLLIWILQTFNVTEEEMTTIHIPLFALYLLATFQDTSAQTLDERRLRSTSVALLLRHLPTGAFSNEHTQSAELQSGSTGEGAPAAIHAYYKNEHIKSAGQDSPLDRAHVASELLRSTIAMFVHCPTSPETFGDMCEILIASHRVNSVWDGDSLTTILETCEAKLINEDATNSSFAVTNSIVQLLNQLSGARHREVKLAYHGMGGLTYRILLSLWNCLSPLKSMHQVEAVHLLWQLDDLAPSADSVKSALGQLMSRNDDSTLHEFASDEDHRAENLSRFAALWKHSVPTVSNIAKTDSRHLQRRGSAKSLAIESSTWLRRQTVLGGLLHIAIDAVRGPSKICRKAAMRIFSTVPSADVALQLLLQRLSPLLSARSDVHRVPKSQQQRDLDQRARELTVMLQQLDSILKHANGPIWRSLRSSNFVESEDADQSAIVWLVTECIALNGDRLVPLSTRRAALSILESALNGPDYVQAQIQSLDLADKVLQHLLEVLQDEKDDTQESLLGLALSTMGLSRGDSTSGRDDAAVRRSSATYRRSSSLAHPAASERQLPAANAAVPSQLSAVLMAGFASGSARHHMDAWLDFLTSSLHFFGEALIPVLIPLVDMFCSQLIAALSQLKTVYLRANCIAGLAPDIVILWLLDGLDIVLAEAHEVSSASAHQGPPRTMSVAAQGGQAFAAAKSQGTMPGTNVANSRLTILLALKDAVRVAMEIWVWASQDVDAYADVHCFSTASNSAARLRSRSRAMLEQIYAVETLETLEVLILEWRRASEPQHSTSVLSLLQVMTPARPKSIVPATLDAMCSRCNIGNPSPSRQSSLTTMLTAADILTFMAAYLGTVDADATDEIWPDCTAFMRDVLSNPMPFRHILPGLVWIASILADGLANTNYGDQRKMRREIGDLFQRLLAACLAISPPVAHTAASTEPRNLTDIVLGRRSMNITVILIDILPRIENILDTSDKILNAVNTINSGVVSHELHAKSFPTNLHPDTLVLLSALAEKTPAGKPWRKEVSEAFAKPRFLETNVELMQRYWMPVLHQWAGSSKEQVNDLLGRLVAPSGAGIMFGVGAAAARVKADIETQTTLRRLCLLLLASPVDAHLSSLQAVVVKLTELFEATALSSPSSAVKAEIFLACRTLVLSISQSRLTPLWPLVGSWLKVALLGGLVLASEGSKNITNIALLQACKMLDLLLVLSPPEFQLHEWLWITDTTDAIHHSGGWQSAALSDQLAEELSTHESNGTKERISLADVSAGTEHDSGTLVAPGSTFRVDTEDVKAMTREDFATSIVLPYLSQLSINVYETVYQMKTADASLHRDELLKDLLDITTLVKHD